MSGGRGGGDSNWTPQEKLPSKNQALLGLKFSSNDSNESDEESIKTKDQDGVFLEEKQIYSCK